MEILDTASSLENAVHFSDVEIKVVKDALHTKLFRRNIESVEVRLFKFQKMVTELCLAFNIPEVKLATGPVREMGFVRFDPASNTLVTEQFLSLVTVLVGFAIALMYHKEELRPVLNPETFEVERQGLSPMAFGLSAFKQAAPRMFDEAKGRGRLVGTSVDYTDDGRLTAEAAAARDAQDADDNIDDTGEDAAPEGATTELPAQRQLPDVDPENRVDRGNGRGED